MYQLLQHSEIEDLIKHPDFKQHACPVRCKIFAENNTTEKLAYFVEEDWLLENDN